MTCSFSFEERRDRARAYATVLRQRLVVLRFRYRQSGLDTTVAVENSVPDSVYEVARAARRLRAAEVALDQAFDGKEAAPMRLEWRRAELEVARLLLEIEELYVLFVHQPLLAA